jgi:protocatechuate 3,4-dioxygenase, beta subunit
MNTTDTVETFAPPPPGTHPPLDWPDYRSTILRHPNHDQIRLESGALDRAELNGPLFGEGTVAAADADLTIGPAGEAVGQRIIVTGRLLEAGGRPIAGSLIEIWQANASGRYRHDQDQWPGTLDPNFTGFGRCITDAEGSYKFTTIRPGCYPWRNHPNAWRPAHLHFSVFGRSFTQRLITQMYFPDDPLFFQDPMINSVPEQSRPALISRYDHEVTTPEWALGFRWDIVLRGPASTPLEHAG